MTLQQLRYMITIADNHTLNKAAEALYVSQPSLSGAVQEVEKELGVVLFNRTGRGMALTTEGEEFISYARQVLHQYESMMERFSTPDARKKHFGVSTQHYSFAVRAFVDLVKAYDTARYDFAIRETQTQEVIRDVSTLKSEIGILAMSDFNRAVLTKLLKASDIEFHPLCRCRAWVYLWTHHPLAGRTSIGLEELKDFPCLSFEQGGSTSSYFAEEILTELEYPRTIHTTDRATNLNLMVALNAYTLCSGVICEELNGPDFVAVPFRADNENRNSIMEIGYIVKRSMRLSDPGRRYVAELTSYLSKQTDMVD